MLEKDKFKEKINNVVNHLKNNDVTNATSELLNCLDDYNSGFDELSQLNTNLESLKTSSEETKKSNEKLREQNMALFLKIGEESKKEDGSGDGEGNQEPPQKRSFEDLFDENGNLK